MPPSYPLTKKRLLASVEQKFGDHEPVRLVFAVDEECRKKAHEELKQYGTLSYQHLERYVVVAIPDHRTANQLIHRLYDEGIEGILDVNTSPKQKIQMRDDDILIVDNDDDSMFD